MDDWARNSGWVYTGIENPQILSQETALAAGNALCQGGSVEDDQVVFGPINADVLRAIDSGKQREGKGNQSSRDGSQN